MKIKNIIKKIPSMLMLLMACSNLSFSLNPNEIAINANNSTLDSENKLQPPEPRELPPKQTPVALKKTVSITIDDLPFVGEYRNFHLNMMINTMTKEQVPATGFIIAREVRKDNWEILRKFRDAGFGLGNHTLSHANLNKMNTEEYIQEIKGADRILHPVLTEPKYFRYPYLAMSSGQKKEDILCYLAKKNYHVAPITVDSKDFVFNQRLLSVPELNRRAYLEELKPFYLDFIWQQTLRAEEHNQFHRNPQQAQILLIHANLLNAYVLPDIINLYKEKGYEFINLEEALKTFKYPIQCSRHAILAHNKKMPLQQKTKNDVETFVEWD
ncbi:polysaccharide deacetylase family protein [Fluoribacter dumoffii]|uniref:polysaccharide deacetylase family protein n=1 Tax=Fluoribacter dumoffii TaxID=463 RepID=UPI002244317C|nr:polysaccharide deacetylase family protein [Fluoribacter dumoffii]MCW8386394.1 polysaccharide deacetylase family protein [Fluoribacter dumoffii]MCW8419447.1 polysaccharide deacetylase family protein [Fluoribacter dumoffii]MCW8452678.1 polysaccharide deacetylase family protein [Fluoribacter dumoffii]MCW8460072.1 polysaccharide deacetylase family protein [Fluoribacter dumoffii]MCW8483550.1 polysaccharide deacetylase family protein [Fluoribacter dumoffii]